MRRKLCLLITLTFLLSACGPGVGDFTDGLGAGYRFNYTSSIGQFITSKDGIVVDTVILDYEYDRNFIAAVSLEVLHYSCKRKLPDGREVLGSNMGFVDKLMFTVIDKKTHEVLRFTSLSEMVSNLKERGFSKEMEFNLSDKPIRLRQASINEINLNECSLVSRKNA